MTWQHKLAEICLEKTKNFTVYNIRNRTTKWISYEMNRTTMKNNFIYVSTKTNKTIVSMFGLAEKALKAVTARHCHLHDKTFHPQLNFSRAKFRPVALFKDCKIAANHQQRIGVTIMFISLSNLSQLQTHIYKPFPNSQCFPHFHTVIQWKTYIILTMWNSSGFTLGAVPLRSLVQTNFCHTLSWCKLMDSINGPPQHVALSWYDS